MSTVAHIETAVKAIVSGALGELDTLAQEETKVLVQTVLRKWPAPETLARMIEELGKWRKAQEAGGE